MCSRLAPVSSDREVPQSTSHASGETGTLCLRKLLQCIHSSVSHNPCYHWSKRRQTKLLITQPSHECFHVYLVMDEL